MDILSLLKSALPLAVPVVTKNILERPAQSVWFEGRDGFDIAGAEALMFTVVVGTTEVVP